MALPVEMVEEILQRLPVKVLLQLRCVCKSWKMLISDPVFAKNKFLRSAAGATRLIATSSSGRHILRSCPLRSVLNAGRIISTELKPPLPLPLPLPNSDEAELLIAGSCHGILCLATVNFVLVWNPTIARFKTLPLPVEGRRVRKLGFGYDSFSHTYKVVAAGYGDICYSSRRFQVNILALGSDTNTNTWRTIDIPWLRVMSALGKFVSGSLNWLASEAIIPYSWFIVSIDLRRESSGVVPLPHYHEHASYSDLSLDVLKDCLCLVAIINTGVHVWLMREHGIKESWTHLFTFSPKLESLGYVHHVLRYKKKEPLRAVCILEDGQVLFDRYGTLFLYNPLDQTYQISKIMGTTSDVFAETETLISPCS